MILTLSVLRCPDQVPPETKRITGGEFQIGRGQENDWVMPDADRTLSKKHCVIAFRNGGWAIADTSTNGTFLNRDAEPIGRGQIRNLENGDRIRLGAYEIEVRVAQEQGLGSFGGKGASPADDPFGDPFGDDVFATKPAAPETFTSSAFGNDPLFGGPPPSQSVAMPSRYDPMALPTDDDFFNTPAQPDHSASFSDAFAPPAVVQYGNAAAAKQILPDDDWDLGFPAAPVAIPPAPSFAPPVEAAVITPPPPQQVAPPPAEPVAFAPPQPAAFAPAPAPQAPDSFAPQAPSSFAPQVPNPFAAEPPSPIAATPNPFAEEPFAPAKPAPLPPQPPLATPLTPVPPAMAATPGTPPPDMLLEAFMVGAGVSGAKPENPEATLRALGAALRATVSGIRQALIARASIKGEFRIEQTMIRARGNNPLKFSADDDDALSALLGIGRRVDMQPAAAVSDALRDMRLHELATMAAMQDAVRDLMTLFDPVKIRADAEQSGGMSVLPAQKKARAFEAFEKLHESVTRALTDDFDSVFGKSFARAYETALRDIGAKEG